MKEFSVFFSWQSDIKENRNLLEKSIEKGLRQCKDIGVFNLITDSRGKIGAPDIAISLFNKIQTSVIYIADLTIVNKNIYNIFFNKRITPNPNVMAEVGYAYKALGSDRILLFYNKDINKPEELPFDINHLLCIPFSKKETENITNKVKQLIIDLNEKNLLKNVSEVEEERKAKFIIEFSIDEKEKNEDVYKNVEYGRINKGEIYLTLRKDICEKNVFDYSKLEYDQRAKELKVSKEEIDKYNNSLPSKKEIEKYVYEYNKYYRCKENAVPLRINIKNIGSKKATNVRVTIECLDNEKMEMFEIEKIEDLLCPKELEKPENPIQKARNKILESSILKTGMLYQNMFKGMDDYSNIQIAQPIYKNLIKAPRNFNIHNNLSIKNNVINIWVKEVLHKSYESLNDFVFVPKKEGEINLKISILCDDYSEPIEMKHKVCIKSN